MSHSQYNGALTLRPEPSRYRSVKATRGFLEMLQSDVLFCCLGFAKFQIVSEWCTTQEPFDGLDGAVLSGVQKRRDAAVRNTCNNTTAFRSPVLSVLHGLVCAKCV